MIGTLLRGGGWGKEQAHRYTGGKVISTQRDWNLKPRNTRNARNHLSLESKETNMAQITPRGFQMESALLKI